MQTVVIGSQKGGSAKTTLAAHLAVEAERRGDGPAWLIDTDQQATLSTWHGRREAENSAAGGDPARSTCRRAADPRDRARGGDLLHRYRARCLDRQ